MKTSYIIILHRLRPLADPVTVTVALNLFAGGVA
jgi:hypothetical protein